MAAPTAAPGAPGFHRLRVAGVQRLCADAVAVSFDVPAALGSAFRFRAGQHLTLRRVVGGVEQRRTYSICAPEGAAPRIGVRRIEGGLFSEWLVDRLAVGDEIEVSAPAGRFTPDPNGRPDTHGPDTHHPDTHRPGAGRCDPGRRHGFVAAGSGITPVLSIVATVLAAHPDNAVTLLYGNRRAGTVMFAEEICDLKDTYGPRLQLMHVLSREPMQARILHGRLDATRLRTLLPALVGVDEVDRWWLCGPLGMVDSAREVLASFGVAPGRVRSELFRVDAADPTATATAPVEATTETTAAEAGPAPAASRRGDPLGTGPGGQVAVSVVLDGRTTSMTLPRDVTLLDAAQRHRADLPFACRGGVCGTCRAKVTGGEVRMRRNFALEPDEIAAGYVLTCQSIPVSAQLTLDYDA